MPENEPAGSEHFNLKTIWIEIGITAVGAAMAFVGEDLENPYVTWSGLAIGVIGLLAIGKSSGALDKEQK